MKNSERLWARRALSTLAIAAAAAFVPGCGVVDESGADQSFVTLPAERASLDLTVPAEGYLEATNASPIAVPRVPTGALKVKELVDEGSIVEKGDVLVVFDDAQLNIDLANHESTLRSAKRRVDKTQLESNITSGELETLRGVATLERDNAESFRIEDDEIFSLQEILENRVREREATETVVYAEAALELRGEYYDIEERILGVERDQAQGKISRVETSLANLVLRAPISGLVVYRKNWRGSTVSIGDTLWPGNVVMSIVDPKSTGLTAFVHERDAAGLSVGTGATVRVDALPDRVFEGRVSRVAEISRPIESNSPVKYTEIQVEIDADDRNLLRPGLRGEARVSIGRLDDAIVVPRSAVRGDADAPYVLVAAGSSTERRAVELGAGDLVRVAVMSGLDDAELVVVGDVPGDSDADGSAPGEAARGQVASAR